MPKTIAGRQLAARSSQTIPIKFRKPYRWIDKIVFGPSACSLQGIYVAEGREFELLADAKTGFCLSASATTSFEYPFVARHVLTLKFVNDTDQAALTPQIAFDCTTDDDGEDLTVDD